MPVTLDMPHSLTVQEAIFTLEPLEGRIFAGYTTGRRWNGWACPCFTKAQAEQIVEAWHAAGYAADYDAASDTFRFAPLDTQGASEPDLGDEEAAEQFGAVEIEGLTLYKVGTGAWVWEDAA